MVVQKHKEKGFHLGIWVLLQRETRGQMPDDRVKKLDDLGFVWEPFKDQWVTNVKYLSKFRKKHGHCRVPAKFKTEDGFRLGKFVANTRTASRKNALSDGRIAELNALGFIWDASKDKT